MTATRTLIASTIQPGADANGTQKVGWPGISNSAPIASTSAAITAAVTYTIAGETSPTGRAPARRSTRSGAIPPPNASSADASGALPPRRTAASSAASSASACSRRGSARQRVGVADRARDQDPQRVAPVGVMALVRHDRGEFGHAQGRERARGHVHARAGEPRAERPGLRAGHHADAASPDLAGTHDRQLRGEPPVRGHAPPQRAAAVQQREAVEEDERHQQQLAPVMELPVRDVRQRVQQQRVVEPQAVDDEQQRQQERGEPERGDRELGPA